MKLTTLRFINTPVTNLSLLKSMPIQSLQLDFRPDRDTELLRSIKTLETINDKPVAEFCDKVEAYKVEAKRPLAFEAPGFDQWVKQISALPPEEQAKEVAKKLQELNPDFDGKVTPTTKGGAVTDLQFFTDNVTDISPVRALRSLSILDIHGSSEGKGKLVNLSPLKGLPLTSLQIYFTQVSDLSPLQDMKLTLLHCGNTLVAELSPLKGMPLEFLDCSETNVNDISPLNGMPLTQIRISLTQVSDLSPLKGMKLTRLGFEYHVTDLSPIKDMPLKHIQCHFNPERDTELLRSIKTLETINEKPAATFWKEVEKQKKRK